MDALRDEDNRTRSLKKQRHAAKAGKRFTPTGLDAPPLLNFAG
jgi:hypothetical protein